MIKTEKSRIEIICVPELLSQNVLCCLQVTVHGAAATSDVVVISINQPANRVEEKISEVER